MSAARFPLFSSTSSEPLSLAVRSFSSTLKSDTSSFCASVGKAQRRAVNRIDIFKDFIVILFTVVSCYFTITFIPAAM